MGAGRTKSIVALRGELGLSTVVLVLGELDTIARSVFPCIFVSNILLKELRLQQEPRVDWNGLLYTYFFLAVIGSLGVLGVSVRKILDNIGLRRSNGRGDPAEDLAEQENPSYGNTATLPGAMVSDT